jgi:hypothetical protein
LPQPSVARVEKGRKRGGKWQEWQEWQEWKSGRVEEWKSGRVEERQSKERQHGLKIWSVGMNQNNLNTQLLNTQHPNTFTPWFTNLLGW